MLQIEAAMAIDSTLCKEEQTLQQSLHDGEEKLMLINKEKSQLEEEVVKTRVELESVKKELKDITECQYQNMKYSLHEQTRHTLFCFNLQSMKSSTSSHVSACDY